MKYIMLALMSILILPAYADDWDVHQNNYELVNKNTGGSFAYRDYVNKDKRHWMVSHKVSDRFKVQYQYWNIEGALEHRPRFDFRLVRLKTDVGNFHITNRTEFRLIRHGDKHVRTWIKLGYDRKFGKNHVKISINPRYNIKKTGFDNGERGDILTTVAWNREINENWTITPGFWYQLDQNNEKKNLYSTLKITYKF